MSSKFEGKRPVQRQLAQRFLDAGHAAPAQIVGQVGILVPLVILDLAPIDKDVALVGIQLYVQAILVQAAAAADILQAGDMIAEDTEVARLVTQP